MLVIAVLLQNKVASCFEHPNNAISIHIAGAN